MPAMIWVLLPLPVASRTRTETIFAAGATPPEEPAAMPATEVPWPSRSEKSVWWLIAS